MSRDRIIQILQDSERQILDLLADAASERDYETIDLARRVAELMRDARSRFQHEADGTNPQPQRRQKKAESISKSSKGSGRGDRRGGSYPRFEVTDDGLVKIGWSKKKNSEYTQRIPRAAFRHVIDVLESLVTNGDRSVSSDTILEAVEARGTDHVPSYQTYGVIRFLRDRGAVRQVQRGEYALSDGIRAVAEDAWMTLEGEET